MDLNVDLHQFGTQLRIEGVAHLTGEAGCTTSRRAGRRVEYTSINGGELNYAVDGGAAPTVFSVWFWRLLIMLTRTCPARLLLTLKFLGTSPIWIY
jgi:hypothetical protein